MIWLRRTVAVALGIPLLAAVLSALVLQGVIGTFLNAGFYTDQLREADVYRFVMEDVLTSAIEEARERDPGEVGVGLRENPVTASGLETPRIIEAMQRGLPPEDLEELVAPAVREVAGYATGEQDTFRIDPRLAETVRNLVAELKALLRDAGVYERLLGQELEPRIEETTGDALDVGGDAPGWVQQLFGGDEEAGSRLARVVTGVVTAEWFATQVEHILDELTPYLVGDSDDFEIRIRLSDAQVAAAVEELKLILRETDAAEFVYSDFLDPTVEESLEETIALPYGIGIGRDEVKEILREVAPPAWVQQQADLLIENVTTYVTGRTDGFSTEISLTRNKQEAARLLTDLVVARVAESVQGLTACSTEAEAVAAAAGSDTLPACLPTGVTVDYLLAEVEAAIAEAIPPLVLDPVPDVVTYTHSDLRLDLREAGGPDALDDTRKLLAEGWSYSSADFRADLSSDPDVLDGLDRFRDFVADGYVHTRGDPAANPLAEVLDEVHDWSDLIRNSGRVAWLVVAVLLVAIGALGGTSWRGRVAWGSASLLVSATLVLSLFWPVYEGVSGELFEQARAEITAQTGEDLGPTGTLAVDKLVDLAEGVLDGFAGGVRLPGLVLAVLALGALLAAIFSPRFIRPDRTLQEQQAEQAERAEQAEPEEPEEFEEPDEQAERAERAEPEEPEGPEEPEEPGEPGEGGDGGPIRS